MGERLQIRRKAKPGPGETMEALRKTRNTPKGKSPKRLGEIEMGGGGVEVGYDEKRRQLHLAFLRERREEAARRVVDSSAETRRVNGVEYGSNDGRFRRGAVDLRAAPDQDADKLLRQLRQTREGGDGAKLGRVLPWTRPEDERDFGLQLKETVEPFWRVRRGGDDDVPLLRKKRGEEETDEDGPPEPPADMESQNQEKRS